MEKVWLITGCSTGFGRELAIKTLAAGYRVTVTSRNVKDVHDIAAGYPETALALALDVTNNNEVSDAVSKTLARFGRLDVLVNNAGIGYFGALEESDELEVRRMFDINFFGLARMTREVLPVMRKQRSGHVINTASIGGLVGFPAVGFYNASKFAVDGYSESLAKETKPLGIKVTVIAPSGFRTDWAGRSANESRTVIEDYAATAGANRATIRANSGRQPGDPAKAAAAIIKVVETPDPPMRLLLGAGALKGARNKLNELKKDFDAWEETTLQADAPPR